MWTDDESFLLTLADRRIIDDDRMSVERPFTKDWNLHIRNVRYSDQGRYICQINTEPVKTKHVQLVVLGEYREFRLTNDQIVVVTQVGLSDHVHAYSSLYTIYRPPTFASKFPATGNIAVMQYNNHFKL